MMINKGLFTSDSSEWETPQELYDKLDMKYFFTLDPCASNINHKCKKYYTKKENGLIQNWSKDRVFMNPPYGREIKYWVKKAYEEAIKGSLVVCLLPSRTDTRWFHDYIYGKSKIEFIKGRLHFSNSKNSAPFPSMIVIFTQKKRSISL